MSGPAAVDKPEPPPCVSLQGGVDGIDSPESARERRFERDDDDHLGPCEAGPSFFEDFSVFQCNIRGFISHRAELEGQLQLLSRAPALICLNETLLDDSVTNDQLRLGGYKLASRRDRDDGRTGGGIACFVADALAEQVVLIEHSRDHERSWHTIHSEIGPVLCGVWYRPPDPGEISSIRACEDEWRRLSGDVVATILVGDLNLHHTRWLRHSASVSVEGTTMFRFCKDAGLKQLVKRPTRDNHLLDLVIADIDASFVEILPRISDHNMVLVGFSVGIPESVVVKRGVFDYVHAKWDELQEDLRCFYWTPMDLLSVDDAERHFHNNVFAMLERHIPRRELYERKSSHPWINERCLEAIRTKNDSAGSERFALQTALCSGVLFEEFVAYTQRMRDKSLGEKRGSKRWWKISNEIMDKSASKCAIPALRSESGWLYEPSSKALFADVCSSKFVLPETEFNEFSFVWPHRVSNAFVLVRRRHVETVLSKLDIESGTGPDGLAARVLKWCSRQLSVPLAKLIRRVVSQGLWPSAWAIHWLVPLHKRKSQSDADNYRAINLTAQVSKVVERFLSPFFEPILDRTAFGVAQFAYRKAHGARDAILYYVLSWIASLNEGSKVGIYCSDVQGAFDRVDAEILMSKLASLNLNVKLLNVIRSWLRNRQGFVIVGGGKSRRMSLSNMVFQGTVWGSSLWNAFFGDCVCAIRVSGYDVVIYADDCNAFKSFPRSLSNALILSDMRECQRSLHKWGRANRVSFDAGKEDTMIVSTVGGIGGPVKLLGVEFDNRLLMTVATHKCAKKAAWKTKSLLRVRRFYNVVDLVMLFKSHVLSFIEYRTAGVHFASSSVLNELDDVQTRFLRQIELSDEAALMSFNLAPLCVRRDIGILGVIHRAAMRAGPPQLWKCFQLDGPTVLRTSARNRRHTMHLVEWPSGRNLDIMRRCALGMIRVYNLLPSELVLKRDLKEFQGGLADLIRDRVVAGDLRWRFLLSPRHPIFLYHPLVHP